MPLSPVPSARRRLAVLFVVAGVALPTLVACGSKSPTVVQQDSSSGAQGGGGAAKPDGAGGDGGGGGGGGGAKSEAERVPDVDGLDPWRRTAEELRGKNGQRFEFACNERGVPWEVWGTGVYTDDSSVCNAAVHAGLITTKDGGNVVIEIQAGLPEYKGSEHNGVDSITYGATPGAFTFPDAEPIDVETTIVWERRGSFYGTKVGSQFTVVCREGGEAFPVWGTGIYTSDSSVCTAAVHAGLIEVGERGEITIEIVDGQDSYEGSKANGITSKDYEKWELSFTFVT